MKAFGDDNFCIVSWNSAALATRDERKRLLRRGFAQRMLDQNSVVGLQEVHGGESAISILFPELSRSTWVHSSAGPNQATGGVTTVLKRSAFASGATAKQRPLVPGRVLLSTVRAADVNVYFVNIHDHLLSASQRKHVIKVVGDLRCKAKADPCHHLLFIFGDVNALAEEESPIDIKTGFDKPVSAAERKGYELFQPLWSDLLELVCDAPTHFNKAAGHVSRIDRMWCSVPKWLFLQLSVEAHVVSDPITIFRRGLSDHAPLRVCFRKAPAAHTRGRAIAQHVIKDKRFAPLLKEYVATLNLKDATPMNKYLLMASAIHATAARIRNLLGSVSRPTRTHQLALLSSVARAVARNDVDTASKLEMTAPFAARHLHILDGRVTLRSAARFETEFAKQKLSHFEDLAAARARRPGAVPSERACEIAMRRKMRMWSRTQPKAFLRAVLTDDGEVESNEGKAKALAEHWGKVFAMQPVDDDAMDRLAAFQPRFGDVPPPSRATLSAVMRRASPTAPGADGIPTSAWLAAGDSGVEVLGDIMDHMLSGFSMGWYFCCSLNVYPPKKTGPQDLGVARAPSDTRPLSMKISAGKIISAAINFTLRGTITAWADKNQRGFVSKRLLTHNVVLADAHARVLGHPQTGVHLPVAFGSDLAAAFPSAHRLWLKKAFAAAQAPRGLRNVIAGMHTSTYAVRHTDEGIAVDYCMFSGIMQGCPLAGLCFVVLFNPVLIFFGTILRDMDKIFACADDLLFLLASISRLALLQEAFRFIALATCLQLNLAKCAIIPLWRKFDYHTAEICKQEVCTLAPSWRGVPVVGSSTFLGCPWGPSATDEDWWRAPMAKFKFRCAQICSSGCAPSLACSLATMRASSVLMYIAQFREPPPELPRIETYMVNKLLHLPGGVLSRSLVTQLAPFAKLNFALPSASCWAARARASAVTFRGALTGFEELRTAAEPHMPLARLDVPAAWSPTFWSSECIAISLSCTDVPAKRPPAGRALERAAGQTATKCARALAIAGEDKVQTSCVREFVLFRFPASDSISEFRRRSAVVLGLKLADFLSERWPTLAERAKPHTLQCAFRTVLNGWPTSHRLEHSPGPCLFGCSGADSTDSLTDHYWAKCPRLHLLISQAWGARVPAQDIARDWSLKTRFDVVASLFTFYCEVARRSRAGLSIDIVDAAHAACLAHAKR